MVLVYTHTVVLAAALLLTAEAAPSAPATTQGCTVSNGTYSFTDTFLGRRSKAVELGATWKAVNGYKSYELCWDNLFSTRIGGDTVSETVCVLVNGTTYNNGGVRLYGYPTGGRPIDVRVRAVGCNSSFTSLTLSKNPIGKAFCDSKTETTQLLNQESVNVTTTVNGRTARSIITWKAENGKKINEPVEVCLVQVPGYGTELWMCRYAQVGATSLSFTTDLKDETTYLRAAVRVSNHCSEFVLSEDDVVVKPFMHVPFPYKFLGPKEMVNGTCLVTVGTQTALQYGACNSPNVVKVTGDLYITEENATTKDGKCIAAIKGTDGKFSAALVACKPGDEMQTWAPYQGNNYSEGQKQVRNAGAEIPSKTGTNSQCLDFNAKPGTPAVLKACA